MPTESLIKSSDTPDFSHCFLLSCEWVVLAGCIAKDFESPILAKWEKIFRLIYDGRWNKYAWLCKQQSW